MGYRAGRTLLFALAVVASAPVMAQAQLRGLGGATGGIGGLSGVGSATGGGIGGVGPNIDAASAPNALSSSPSLPARPSTGVNSVTGTADALSRPVTNTVTNSLTGTVTNTLAVPGQATRAIGTTINQVARSPAIPPRRSGVPPAGERRFVPDQVVISLPPALTTQARDALLARHRLTVLGTQRIALTGTTFLHLRIADGRPVAEVIRALEADGARTAQPNYRFALTGQANVLAAASASDTANVQYAAEKLKLRQAHQLASGRQVRVALIDTAVDSSHPEIAGNIADSFDALGGQAAPHAHGTAMAGAIVAHARLAGVAPSARILAIRAFGASGAGTDGTTMSLLESIDWAVAHGARVINMSFAGPPDPELARALAAARRGGVVLIAAAGNAGPKSPPLFPAADPSVIAVTAIDVDDKLLPVANRGKHIAVAAPGVDVLAVAPNGGYQLTSGTSIAAAHISGLAALLLERKPDLTADGVRKILMASAIDLGPKGRDDQFGAGLADAYAAILSLTASDTIGPTATATRQSAH